MNLSLSKDKPRNTTLVLPDGHAIYHVKTPSKLLDNKTTTISRVDAGVSDVGLIKWHTFSSTELWVRGRLIQHHKSGSLSSSKVFLAADGRNYKWKTKGDFTALVENDSDTPVATFQKSKKGFFSSGSASLDITPQGMHIVDDIVTTFVWFEHKRREDEEVEDIADEVFWNT